jgi:isocitrate dehydrogenase kinase/phosphatase
MVIQNDKELIKNILKNESEPILNTINIAYMKILSSCSQNDFEGNYLLGTILCEVLMTDSIKNSQDKIRLAKIAEDALSKGNPLTRGIVPETDYEEIKRKMDEKFAVIEKYKNEYE